MAAEDREAYVMDAVYRIALADDRLGMMRLLVAHALGEHAASRDDLRH